MNGIDSLKERLLSEDKIKASEIESEARKKAEEIIQAANLKAAQIEDELRQKAQKDGKDRKERMIARAELDARNIVLQAKQEAIDLIFSEVIKKIDSMSKEEYSNLVNRMILNNVETGEEEIVLSVKDKDRVQINLDEINKQLVTKGKRGLLRINSECANIPSGFILRKSGLEINCTFEALIRGLRDELEADIASMLF
ncbi:MAG: V-type ATP synthase subunit E family protein [Caloramator sp.]|nr:V-type ATP synthase subunit E family protein [Caloramator sp.]